MRLYLEDKDEKGIERDEDSGICYLELSMWSFLKCQILARLFLYILLSGIFMIFWIVFGGIIN